MKPHSTRALASLVSFSCLFAVAVTSLAIKGESYATRAISADRSAPAGEMPQVITVFDIDATLFFLETAIYLLNPSTGEVRKVPPTIYDGEYQKRRNDPTSEWSKFRNFTAADKAMYQGQPISSSFLEFTSEGGVMRFAEQLEAALNGNFAKAKGPAYDYFIARLQDPVLAAQTYINTAREHSLDDFQLGFQKLQAHLAREGIQIYLPPRENYIGVGTEAAKRGVSTMEVKADKNIEIVDRISKSQVSRNLKLVTDSAGTGRSKMTIFEFLDDGDKNIEVSLRALVKIKALYPNEKIVLADVLDGPRAYVLKDDGTVRLATADELDEMAQVSKKWPQDLIDNMRKNHAKIEASDPFLRINKANADRPLPQVEAVAENCGAVFAL